MLINVTKSLIQMLQTCYVCNRFLLHCFNEIARIFKQKSTNTNTRTF